MAEAGLARRLGATPGKLGAVAVLAIVLGGLVLFQFSGSSAPATTSRDAGDARKKPRLAEKAAPSVSSAPAAAPRADAPTRLKVPLEEAIRHDPFALTGSVARLAAAKSSESQKKKALSGQPDDRKQRVVQTVAGLRSKGVQMILLSGGEKMAIVGGRRVRIGDTVDGLRVISITARGVTLSEQADKRP